MLFSLFDPMKQTTESNRATVALFQLIKTKDWDCVNHLLAKLGTAKYKYLLRSTEMMVPSDLIIHHACQSSAPLRLIVGLSTICPSSVDTADENGRYPLHLAVASGCAPEVIQFLIQRNPTSAAIQDTSGKTPLHYAGECYAEMFINNNLDLPDSEIHRNTYLVVQMLVAVAPHAANMEDEDEMNPIEYAVLNSTHLKVIKMMQQASRKEWRKQAPEGKGQSIHRPVAALQA